MIEVTVPLILFIGYLILVSKSSIINFGEINIYNSDNKTKTRKKRSGNKELPKKQYRSQKEIEPRF